MLAAVRAKVSALVVFVLAAGCAGGGFAASNTRSASSAIPPPNSTDWQLNSSATMLADGSLQMTDGVVASVGSAFFKTPINPGSVTISFDVTMTGSGGGNHADGVTVDLIDATTQPPTALGRGGGGLGFTGLSGIGVSLDDYYNYECDPSSNFVAVVDGTSCGNGVVAHLATSTSIPQLWGNTTHATVTFTRGSTSNVKLWVNGTLTLDINVSNIPASAYLGFTGSNGGYWQRQVISNVVIDGGTASTYAAGVLADNPLGYWRLGEASGSTAVDASGSQNNGAYSLVGLGTGGAIAGDKDSAASFDGSSSFATTPIVRSAADLTKFTYEAWASVPSTQTFQTLIMGSAYEGALAIEGGTGRPIANICLTYGTDQCSQFSPNAVSNVSIADGSWHHVAATWDGSVLRVYVDGELTGASPPTGPADGTSPYQLEIGRAHV